MADQVTVIWRGPFDGELPNGGVVRPGDELTVGSHELESAHFEQTKAESAVVPDKPAVAFSPIRDLAGSDS